MIPLLVLKEPDLLNAGIFPSLPANQLVLWKTAENVFFNDGVVEKIGGWTQEIALPSEVLALQQAYVEGEKRVYAATADKVYKWNAGVSSEIGTGFTAENWSLESWGSWLVGTNDVDVPQVWKNAASMVPLGGVNFTRAKLFKKLQNHLLAFNTNVSGQQFNFSSKSNPEDWVTTASNSAGDLFIRDLDAQIEAVELLGESIGFYSADMAGIVQYVGAPLYFGAKVMLNGIGAVSQYAVVQVGRLHYGLSKKGFWRSDMVSFDYIDTPAVNRWFQDNINWASVANLRSVHLEQRNVVLWIFDCQDAVRRGLAYNYKTRGWTIIKAPWTALLEQQILDRPLVGTTAGWGYLDQGANAITAALSASLVTNSLDAGRPERLKGWDCLRVDRDSVVGGMEVRFGFGDRPGTSDYWSSWTALDYENWIHQEAAYLTVEFRSTEVDAAWRISGLTLLGTIGGYVV